MRPIVKYFNNVAKAMAWLEQVSGGLSEKQRTRCLALLSDPEQRGVSISVMGDCHTAYVD